MKKIIALLLTLIMIFSLTACEKLSAQGQKVSAMLTGMNSKTVKLTIEGDIIEGTVKSIDIPTDDGGGTFASAEVTKDKGKKAVIKFKGLEAGGGVVNVLCSDGDELLCRVTFALEVLSDMKLSCSLLTVEDGEFLDIKSSGDNNEEASENVKFPVMEEDSSLIFLRNLGGEWVEGDFNSEVAKPAIIGYEDDFVKYQIVPVSSGEAHVQFINLNVMKQVLATYTIAEKELDEQGKPVYSTVLKDYIYTDYTMEEYLASRGQGLTIQRIKLFDAGFDVPENYIIKGYALYNAKTEKVFEFEDSKAITDTVLPDNIDTASINFEFEDNTMEYTISKSLKLDAIIKQIDALKATESVEELTIGAKTVKYYQMTYGFGQAVWEDDEMVKQMIFSSEKQTADGNKALLKEFVK